MRLLIIEDEKELAQSIVDFIGKENYNIDLAYNLKDADDRIGTYDYDCAFVDIMLPDGSGFELVKMIKKLQPKCGIIVTTAKDTINDKLYGLDLGADDYITKPFYLAELNARFKALLRRSMFDGSQILKLNELTIDIDKRELRIEDKLIELTKSEFDILLFFATNKERALTKETIVEHIWGDDSSNFDNFDFVYTHIKNLRKKLLEHTSNDYIHSIYGIGYKFSLK